MIFSGRYNHNSYTTTDYGCCEMNIINNPGCDRTPTMIVVWVGNERSVPTKNDWLWREDDHYNKCKPYQQETLGFDEFAPLDYMVQWPHPCQWQQQVSDSMWHWQSGGNSNSDKSTTWHIHDNK